MTLARVLITGAAGLVGRSLSAALSARRPVEGIDLRIAKHSEQRDFETITVEHLDELRIDGVIHLAAVSRIVEAHNDPDRCWKTNFLATRNLLQACGRASHRPWLLFASSREVYGEQKSFPVRESAPLSPVNIYGLAKLKAEEVVLDARRTGLRTAIVRLSNVYGSVWDHSNRVIPAFAIAAASGRPLHVHGPKCEFDFTHIDDVVRGICSIVELLEQGERKLPVVHLVSGTGTTLQQLAELIIGQAVSNSTIVTMPRRYFDVTRFVGDGALAKSLLDWRPAVVLESGVARLISEFVPLLVNPPSLHKI